MKPDAKAGEDAVAGFYKEVSVMTTKVRGRSGSAENMKKLLCCNCSDNSKVTRSADVWGSTVAVNSFQHHPLGHRHSPSC